MLAYRNRSEEVKVSEERERGLKENWTVLAYGNGHMGTEVRNRMRSTAFFSARAMHQARPLKDLCLVQSTSA